MWRGEGKVRKGIIDNIDPSHSGNELVVVDKSGNCTMIYGSGNTWTAKTLWKDPGTPGLARIAVGEADPSKSGKEIVVGGDSNNVGLIWREGDEWQGKVIFTDTDKIRGTGIGDIDPTSSGNEIVTFGYSKRVTLLTRSGDNWKSRTIFTDTGRSHDLVLGEGDSTHDGLEVVIGGYSNNVTMISVSPWFYDVLWTSNNKISGCTSGDLDPTRAGKEIVAVDGVGRVEMIFRTSPTEWDHIELWQGEGELITPIIGNFYPEHDGNELLVVGMALGPEGEGAGQATMIYGSGDNWKSAVIFTNEDSMLHGAAVGDLDLTSDGDELIVMSFGFDVKMLTWTGPADTDWTSTFMWRGEGKVRKGIIDDVNPFHSGNELVVVDKSGNCTMISGSGTTWTAKTLWKDPGTPGLARVAIGDADTSISGKEIVVGGDSNNVGIIWREGDTWKGKVIFTDTDKIRGTGIGDIDPVSAGNEIAVFSYSKKVTLLTRSGSDWKAETIFVDTGRSNDLALGEFDPEHTGQELMIGGYSNNVTMIMNSQLTEKPDFSIYGYPATQAIDSGESVEFTIGVLALNGFNEQVKFAIENLPAGFSAEFYPETVIPDSATTVTITTPISKLSSNLHLLVNATSSGITHTFNLHLDVSGDSEPPEVESTYPTDKASDVPAEAPVVIWFNEPMDPLSFIGSTVKIVEDESGTEYEGTLQYNVESNMLIVNNIHEKNNPSNVFPAEKLIKVTIANTVSDLAGNTLSENFRLEFLTAKKDTTGGVGAPEIEAVYPVSDATGVSTDSPIIVEFKIPVDATTLTSDNIEMTSDNGIKYDGTINYDPNSLVLTINNIESDNSDDFTTGFTSDAKITVKLNTGIKSIDGQPLSSTFSWTFETGESEATNGDTDKLEEERDAYLIGLIVTIIIIILLLLALVSGRKNKPSEDSDIDRKKDNGQTKKKSTKSSLKSDQIKPTKRRSGNRR
jgi:hypothetical protein